MKSKLKYLAAVGLLIVLAAAAILLKNKLPLADPDISCGGNFIEE